jgi:hypothetical protein
VRLVYSNERAETMGEEGNGGRRKVKMGESVELAELIVERSIGRE